MTDLFVTDSAAGGGAGTEGDPFTMAEATANVTSSDKVWVKAGTYSVDDSASSSVMDIDVAGTVASPVEWEAYTTTTGDFTIGDAQPAVIDANTNTLTNAMQSTAIHNQFIGLQFTGASSHGVSYGSFDFATFTGCKFDTNGGRGFAGDNNIAMIACEFTGNTTNSFDMDNTCVLIACKFHNEAEDTAIVGSNCCILSNQFYNNGNGTNLLVNGAGSTVLGNTFDGDNQAASVGYEQSGSSNLTIALFNNIFFDLNVAVTSSSGTVSSKGYNLFFSNNTDYASGSLESTDVSGTSDPFTDSANRDYTLKTGSQALDAGLDAGNI